MSSTQSERFPYAAALDGLRAIAVVAVVGYHLDISWMRGGFLGVDLFFVISGFLITRLLLSEFEKSGRIALGAFWIRRFRRLVPPLVVVVAVSVIATRLWGAPAQWAAMRGDAVASLGYVANWRFVINDTSYFETLLGPSPLRHIWSLAVEEQWYLLWPLAMAGLAPWAVSRSRFGTAGALLIVAAGASAVWMGVLYDPADLSRVYYGTDTRAQQLLVGAALAWFSVAAPGRFDAAAMRRLRIPANLTLVGFVGATVLIDDDAAWLYHGGLLALAFGAAVLVATASLPGDAGPLGWLSWRPLVAVGRRSYSLYLWHWPVIVFVGPPMGLELSALPLAALRILVSVALTEATYRWIESPARRSTRRPLKTVVAWSTAAVITVVGASTTLATEFTALPAVDVLRPTVIPEAVGAVPQPTITGTATLADRARPAGGTTGAGVAAASDGGRESAETPQPTLLPAAVAEAAAAGPVTRAPGRLLLVGDSTALVLAVGRLADQPAGWQTIEYARLGCAITDGETVDVGDDEPTKRDNPGECKQWADDWAELSRQFQPSVSVVMIGAWEVLDHVVDGRRLAFPSPEWTDHVDAALRRGVEAASAGGGRVALVTLPCMEQSAGSLVNAQARNDPARVETFNAIVAGIADDLNFVDILPLDELLCPDGEPVGDIYGESIRFDGVHLTDAGTELVWTWLGVELAALYTSIS